MDEAPCTGGSAGVQDLFLKKYRNLFGKQQHYSIGGGAVDSEGGIRRLDTIPFEIPRKKPKKKKKVGGVAKKSTKKIGGKKKKSVGGKKKKNLGGKKKSKPKDNTKLQLLRLLLK
jgi:hypothetical protein